MNKLWMLSLERQIFCEWWTIYLKFNLKLEHMQDSNDLRQTEHYEHEQLFSFSLKLLYRSFPWQTFWLVRHRCSQINNGCITFRWIYVTALIMCMLAQWHDLRAKWNGAIIKGILCRICRLLFVNTKVGPSSPAQRHQSELRARVRERESSGGRAS